MRCYLSGGFVLKRLESPSLYDLSSDELYELDEEGFRFMERCSSEEGCDSSEGDRDFIAYCLDEGILTETPVSPKRPVVKASPVPSLRYLELQITDRCNLRCRHCYIGEPENREIPVADLRSVLEEFETMQGLRLLVTGGEALMHSRFEEFNEMLPSYGFRKILFSNGLLLNRERIKCLNVDEIQLSVDGLERGHDALRGMGTFRKVIRAAEEAHGEGMQVSVATMVHKENLAEFDEMERLFRSIGVREWSVDVPCAKGRLADNDMLAVPPEIGGRYLNYGFGEGLHGGGEGFGCGLHLASVLAGGDICKCSFYSHCPAGHIHEGLRKAWGRIKPVALRELECSDNSCAVLEECRGGCRYRAGSIRNIRREQGDDGLCVARDLYKCYCYGIMK